MKTTPFTFNFKGGQITVRAFNKEAAKILAQAEAIRRCWDYTIIENPCLKCSLNYNGSCCGCDKGREYERIIGK